MKKGDPLWERSFPTDPKAFNRGVDEVLLLKPVWRLLRRLLASWRPGPGNEHQEGKARD